MNAAARLLVKTLTLSRFLSTPRSIEIRSEVRLKLVEGFGNRVPKLRLDMVRSRWLQRLNQRFQYRSCDPSLFLCTLPSNEVGLRRGSFVLQHVDPLARDVRGS